MNLQEHNTTLEDTSYIHMQNKPQLSGVSDDDDDVCVRACVQQVSPLSEFEHSLHLENSMSSFLVAREWCTCTCIDLPEV